nr:spry domain protein [uncultured Mediterranean phage uvMED]
MVFPIAGGNESKGYEISNSLRFDDGSSAYLNRTQTAGNRRTWTWSGWIKRGVVDTRQNILSAGNDGNDESQFRFDATGYLRFKESTGNSPEFLLDTNALFRDPAAWYHFVVAVDTTQSTDSDRIKIYVNGSQITSFNSPNYPSQNYDTRWNNNSQVTYLGMNVPDYRDYYDGYMTEVNFVDGSQKAPTDFGEFDDNGVWIPKKYSGSYGTNGYFLQFKQTGTSQNSSGIGADTSGQDNHFAVSGIAATDVTEDTCTNNFATMNSIDKDGHTNAEGNLEVSGDVVYGMQRGTIGASSGKWYFEARLDVYQGDTAIALANEDENIFTKFSGETTNSVGYLADGRFFYNSSATTYSSLSAGNIFQIAFDADSGKIWIGKNNTWQNSGDPANGSGQVQTVSWNFFLPAARTVNNNGNGQLHFNFGQDSSFAGASTAQNNSDGKYGDFYYAPPSGFYALCTKRLAEFG